MPVWATTKRCGSWLRVPRLEIWLIAVTIFPSNPIRRFNSRSNEFHFSTPKYFSENYDTPLHTEACIAAYGCPFKFRSDLRIRQCTFEAPNCFIFVHILSLLKTQTFNRLRLKICRLHYNGKDIEQRIFASKESLSRVLLYLERRVKNGVSTV